MSDRPTSFPQYVDLIDSLLGPDDDPASALSDLQKIAGLRFDGNACATCPKNCCIVHDPATQYIAIRDDELAAIYAAHPDAPRVRATTKGLDGRRYYTVTQKGQRCAFLGADLKCTVYDARPRYCRENPGNPYQIAGWEGAHYDLERCPGTSYERPVLCLSSGGLDSLVLQAHLKAGGYTPYSLFIDYGQPARRSELDAARKICTFYGGEFYLERVQLDLWKEHAFFLSEGGAGAPVPLRNLVFFSIAAAYCDTLNIPRLGLAWDGKRERFTLPKRFEIIAPLVGKTKLSVARMGNRYGAPFELSWSCQRPGPAPCGECAKCVKRAATLARVARSGSSGSKGVGSSAAL